MRDNIGDEIEELLKDRGPTRARVIQADINNLKWIDVLRVLGEDDRFVEDDYERWHLTDEVDRNI